MLMKVLMFYKEELNKLQIRHAKSCLHNLSVTKKVSANVNWISRVFVAILKRFQPYFVNH